MDVAKPFGNRTDPNDMFRFAVTTTLTSVVVLTGLAAVLVALNMPEALDPSETEAEYWGAAFLVFFTGILVLLPVSVAMCLVGWPIARVLRRSPVLVGGVLGALLWAGLSICLAMSGVDVSWFGLVAIGAFIGGLHAKMMTAGLSEPSE